MINVISFIHTRGLSQEIFSLLAYPDVNSSPVAHLMAKSGRDELATQLNAAILGNNFIYIPWISSSCLLLGCRKSRHVTS